MRFLPFVIEGLGFLAVFVAAYLVDPRLALALLGVGCVAVAQVIRS